ncbi:MAG: hypothetical protein WDO18_21720 [Acidobacteriota bacterium]
MAFYASFGRSQEGSQEGPALILEAAPSDLSWSFKKGLRPEVAAEIARLQDDGHRVSMTKNRITVTSSLGAIRATQLYRTLPHEIGHLVDYKNRNEAGDDSYWQRPAQEREAFAHRYADEFRSRMLSAGSFPFSRVESWIEDGLRACDFAPNPPILPAPDDGDF